MPYTLKFEHPHFPPDYEFAINDLGVVKNGASTDISEDQERSFIANRGMSIEDAYGKNESGVTLSGSSTIGADELKSLLPATAEEVTSADTSMVSGSGADSAGADSASTAVVTPPADANAGENTGGEF